jgi:hypothetical protein
MSKGLTGDEDGAIRAWAVKVEQTLDQIKAEQEELKQAIDRAVFRQGGSE